MRVRRQLEVDSTVYILKTLLTPRGERVLMPQLPPVSMQPPLVNRQPSFNVSVTGPQTLNPLQFFTRGYYQPATATRPVSAVLDNGQRLNAVHFPRDLAPEEYICRLTGKVMTNPVELPDTHKICDGLAVLKALARKPQNPFNQQPMTKDDVAPQLALKAEINRYVDAVEQAVQDKQKESGREVLERADYENIHAAAMNRSASAAAPRR